MWEGDRQQAHGYVFQPQTLLTRAFIHSFMHALEDVRACGGAASCMHAWGMWEGDQLQTHGYVFQPQAAS